MGDLLTKCHPRFELRTGFGNLYADIIRILMNNINNVPNPNLNVNSFWRYHMYRLIVMPLQHSRRMLYEFKINSRVNHLQELKQHIITAVVIDNYTPMVLQQVVSFSNV